MFPEMPPLIPLRDLMESVSPDNPPQHVEPAPTDETAPTQEHDHND